MPALSALVRPSLVTAVAIVLAALALPAAALATAPTAQLWQLTGGGTDLDRFRTIMPLADGSTIAVGSFSSPTGTFGASVFTASRPSTSAADFLNNDAVIARVNSDGTYRWVKHWGGVKPDLARGVARQPDGTIIVTGQFGGTVSFDGISKTSAGTSGWWADIFIVALDPDTGAIKWLTTLGGSGDDYTYHARTLADGSIVLVGSGQTVMQFGSFSLPAVTGAGDWWVARYNADGTFRWAHRVGGSSDYDDPFGFDVLADGSIVATGYSGNNAVYGTATLATNNASADITVLKMNASGDVLWARRAGGPSDDFGYSIAGLPNGDVAIAGYVKGVVTFHDGTSLPATGGGDKDAFWARYDGSGNLLWAKRAAGTGEDALWSVTARSDGRLIATGSFNGTTTFGTTTVTSAGGSDMVLLAIDAADGDVEWVHRSGGTGGDVARTSATLGDGSILLAGNLWGTAHGTPGSEDAVLQRWLMEPEAPAEPEVVRSPDGTSAAVTIVPLEGDAVTQYVVTSIPDSRTCQIQPPATTCTVHDLRPEQAYTFSVTAVNATGSSASTETAAATPASPTSSATVAASPTRTTSARSAIRLRGRSWRVGLNHYTAGRVPAGVTSVTQTVTLERSVLARFTRSGRAAVTVRCPIAETDAGRRYRCSTTLAAGVWRIATTGRAANADVTGFSRRVTVRLVPHQAVTG